MLNVLIADDEENIRELYKIRLVKRGYNVILASNGEEAINLIYKGGIDIAIIDVMMPIYNGYEIVDSLRADNINIPIILATAKGTISDKREGFNAGADDYLVKPFDMDELVLRIEALVKRYKIIEDNVYNIGDVTLDSQTLTVKNKNTSITLSKREFSILFKLLTHIGHTYTKEQIFDEFFGIESDADMDSVKVYISKIRKQISVFKSIDIKTIRGLGYRGVVNE